MSNKQEPYPCTCFDFFSTAENKCKGAFHGSRVPFTPSRLEFHDFFIINIIINIINIIIIIIIIIIITGDAGKSKL